MIRTVPFLVWLVLLVFCLVDLDRTDATHVRRLSIGWWYVLVVVVPILGAVGWLLAGRPPRRRRPAAARVRSSAPLPSGPVGPGSAADIDRRLHAELDRIDREFDEAVRGSQQRARPGGTSARARGARPPGGVRGD